MRDHAAWALSVDPLAPNIKLLPASEEVLRVLGSHDGEVIRVAELRAGLILHAARDTRVKALLEPGPIETINTR